MLDVSCVLVRLRTVTKSQPNTYIGTWRVTKQILAAALLGERCSLGKRRDREHAVACDPGRERHSVQNWGRTLVGTVGKVR